MRGTRIVRQSRKRLWTPVRVRGREGDILCRLCIGLVLPAIHVKFEREGRTGMPIKEQAAHREIALTQGVFARIAMLPVSPLLGANGNAITERVGDRAADKALDIRFLKPPEGSLKTRARFGGGFRRDVIHRTAGGILSEQSALRAFENFHPRQIE